MFASILRKWRKMIQLLLNKTTPHFQILTLTKVDQSLLRILEVPPLQYPKKSYNTEAAFKHLTLLRSVYHVIKLNRQNQYWGVIQPRN